MDSHRRSMKRAKVGNAPDKDSLCRGRRVLLRVPRKDDLSEFLALVRASRRLHRPWVDPPSNADRFREYLKRCQRDDFEGLFLCDAADGKIIGTFNISQIFRGGFQNAVLGYYAAAGSAGNGYMTEGMRLVLRFAFVRLKLHRLEANIQPANRSSIRLARRCGFRKEGFSPRYLKVEGRWRDHERWAITVEDWRRTFR